MTHAILVHRPGGAAMICRMGRALMDVILHVGAHRTATTTFQHYIRAQETALAQQQVHFWGPQQVRKSVFPGLFRKAALQNRRHAGRRATGRVSLLTAKLADKGIKQLIVSDENMIGTCVQNFRAGCLYPGVGERMARVAAAFDGRITRVVLSLRAQDLWWASAAAFIVARGHAVPDAGRCRAITQHPRSWRDVITDLACAVPDVDIQVVPFENATGQPQELLETVLGQSISPISFDRWLNRSDDLASLRRIIERNGGDPAVLPDGAGRWQPFTADQCAAMRETYADDLHWLTAGADGLARLTSGHPRTRADTSLPPGQYTKGQSYDEGHANAPTEVAQHR